MNTTAFFRILWKEYRTQLAFWVSVAAAIALIDLALAADVWFNENERTQGIFAVALTLAALYALGSSTTLFATERENGTYDILQALPVGPWTVFFGKTVFAILSTAAMLGCGLVLARIIAGRLPEVKEPLAVVLIWGFIAAEFIVWGIFFSLLLSRTIVAAILAGMGAFFALCYFSAWGSKSELLLGPVLLVGLLTPVSLLVASRWLRERRLPRAATVRAAIRRSKGDSPIFATSRPTIGRPWEPAKIATVPGLGRLLWQENRQSFVLTAAILATLLPFGVLSLSYSQRPPDWLERFGPAMIVLPAFFAFMSAGYFSPLLLGSTVFLGDQVGHRFRFLAEHGISPRLVWLSRQIRGLAIMLLGLLALDIVASTFRPERVSPQEVHSWYALVSGYVVAAYACGQLCSMLFRSGILAVAFGGILTAVVCGWAYFVFLFGMSWLWTVAPLLVAFMAATWLHAPNWLVERKTWRARLRLALLIAVPAVAILAAIPLVRIYEIPRVDPGFDPNSLNWPMPEGKQTLTLYAQAHEFYLKSLQKAEHPENTPVGGRTFQEDKSQAIALAIEASYRPLPGFYVAPFGTAEPLTELALADLVRVGAGALQREGKLDAALDHYLAAMRIVIHAQQRYPGLWVPVNPENRFTVVRWKNVDNHARHEAYMIEARICEDLLYWGVERGQTSDRVLRSRQALEELWRTPPPYCEEIKYIYLQLRHVLKDKIGLVEARDAADLRRFETLASWMPWERERALRILDMLTAERIARCRLDEAAMAEGRSVPPVLEAELEGRSQRDAILQQDNVTYNAVQQNVPDLRELGLDEYVSMENCHRSTRLVLALEAWRLDHGHLPDALDELQDKYLDRIPVDPSTGERFAYEPHGIGVLSEYVGFISFRIEPGQPFVGGPLQPGRVEGGVEDRPAFPQGWVFPIPKAGGKPVRPKTGWSEPKADEPAPRSL